MPVATAQVDVFEHQPISPKPSAKIAFIAILLLLGNFAFLHQKLLAQEFSESHRGVTLSQAIARALQSNPDLAAANKEVAATDALIGQAAARVNPEVSLLVEDLKKETRTTTVQVNQVLETGNKRIARIGAAQRNLDAADLDRQVKQADIRASVINAFFDMLIAQERLSLAQSSAALADRATGVASRRVTAGKLSPVEETKAKVAQANVLLDLHQAQSDLDVTARRLSATWGAKVSGFGYAIGQYDDIPLLASNAELADRMRGAPMLKRAQLEVARRDALATVEKTRRTPNVTASVGMKRVEDIGRNQVVIGLAIPLPLFDRNQGNLLEALRRTDKARDELAGAEVRPQADLYQAVSQYEASKSDIALLQNTILPGAQSAYDAATKGFEYGKFGFLDVLDAQRTLLLARTQYLRALGSIHRAAADVDRILGTAASVPATAMTQERP